VVSNLGPGDYRVEVVGQLKAAFSSGTGYCEWQISDGTTTSGSAGAITISTATRNSLSSTSGRFNYSTPQTSVTFSLQGKAIGTVNTCAVDTINNDLEIRVYKFPTSSQVAFKADQTNYPWTAYTPTYTGLGTVANDSARWKRQGEDMLLRVDFDCGTSTATEARISLPGSYVSSANINTLEIAGNMQRETTAEVSYAPAIEASKAYITFMLQGTGFTGATTKRNGSDICASGNKIALIARIPIEGWRETMDAPLIKNSVVTSYAGVTRIEYGRVGGGASDITSCTSNPCTTYRESPGVSSVTRTSTGKYVINFEAGKFSSAPVCTVSGVSTGNTSCMCNPGVTSPTSTAFYVGCVQPAVAVCDIFFDFTCMGAN